MNKFLIALIILGLQLSMSAQNFITRSGKNLKYHEENIMLRGMAFGNLVWNDDYANTPNLHHSEIDYQRLEDLGMNAIRFYLNYKTFEDDSNPYSYKQNGWDWIDQNVEWAKAHGVYLILNMHIPQGGFQSRCEGDALWTEIENQNRLVALWGEIAKRYKDEPQIAGFDILNEPTPSGTIQNWSNLAQRIIDKIRTEDNNHLIITERAIALGCDYGYADSNNNYPQIVEENLMYTVHMYDPFEFTHQNLDWVETGDGGSYPDNSKVTVPVDAVYATGNYSNPNIRIGNSDWNYFAGNPFNITVDSLIFGRVVFQTRNIGSGKVFFDDFILEELNQSNEVINTIYSVNPTSGSYWDWSENGTGFYSEETEGNNDAYSVSVSGNTAGYSLILTDYTFKVNKGSKYRVSGWMKGENIPSGATASFGTDFSYSPSGEKVGGRNYDFLVEKITEYSEYIENLEYPVYFGEFGAARNTFENDKGGDRWVRDCINIFDSLGYHFTYHSYKEEAFGYYLGWEKPVEESTVNTALKKVFEDYFSQIVAIESKENFDQSVFVYPNPVVDQLKIENNFNQAWKVYNSNGIEVLSGKGNSLNTNLLEVGIYILEANGSRIKFQKIE